MFRNNPKKTDFPQKVKHTKKKKKKPSLLSGERVQ